VTGEQPARPRPTPEQYARHVEVYDAAHQAHVEWERLCRSSDFIAQQIAKQVADLDPMPDRLAYLVESWRAAEAAVTDALRAAERARAAAKAVAAELDAVDGGVEP
jgi:hypothetical protein